MTTLTDQGEGREDEFPIPSGFRMLAIMVAVMIGGGFQVVAAVFRPALWGAWALTWLLIYWVGRRLDITALFRPILPLLVWVAAYYLWGSIVSPLPVLNDAIRMGFFFITIVSVIAIATSRGDLLATFANYVQIAVAANLIITILLINVPSLQSLFISYDLVHSEGQLSSDHFSGLWGNANVAGLVSLIIFSLSAWAKPPYSWLGRVAAVVLIFLTVSRTANLLLIALMLLYLAVGIRRRVRLLLVAAFAYLFVLGSVVYVASGNSAEEETFISQVPEISRIFDISESQTREKGYDSRIDVLKKWFPYLENGPWYGYGLNAMSGGGSQGRVFRTDIPYMGIHNLYLGLWLDAGVIGLLSFILLIAGQFRVLWRRSFRQDAAWGIYSVYLVVLVFSLFNHNMLSSMEGMICYALVFLLPQCPALRRIGEVDPGAGGDTRAQSSES